LLFEVGSGAEFTGFGASDAGIYAALIFGILKSSFGRHTDLVIHIIFMNRAVLLQNTSLDDILNGASGTVH